MVARTAQPSTTHDRAFRDLVEAHQAAVRAHCYRMLGSLQDAEDLTQETLLRAWRSLDRFEGRGALRAWLYQIATNACLNELTKRGRGRRWLPSLRGTPLVEFTPAPPRIDETPWLEPMPDAWLEVADPSPGPEARYESREAVELAFVAALQRLAPRQRAVLLLRDVLGWSARDVAVLLEMSVPAANSALQRARARLADLPQPPVAHLSADAERLLLARYVAAWEHADVDALVALLREDAVLSMPPLAEWYVGRAAIAQFLSWATSPAGGGPFKFVPTRANGSPAFGIYDREGRPIILHVVEFGGDRVAAMTSWMNPSLFPFFSLPASSRR